MPGPDLAAIQAVVLDAGGVLVIPDADAIRRGLGALGGPSPDDEACRRAHYAAMAELDRRGVVDWPSIDQWFATDLGVPSDRLEESVAVVEDVYLVQPWRPIAGAAEVLHRLDAIGYQLAVVSNATGSMEEQLATHAICSVDGGACVQVAIVVDSAVVGVEKPDPAIFTFALDALGLDPAQCIYVGDTVFFDVNGARAAGLVPAHVDPFGDCGADDHLHLTCLEELLELLPSRVTSSSG